MKNDPIYQAWKKSSISPKKMFKNHMKELELLCKRKELMDELEKVEEKIKKVKDENGI